jgi:hypothetical protein
MNAFELATDLIFADRHMAVDALWREGGAGDGVQCRVIRFSPDRIANFGEGRFLTDSVMIDVRIKEVPVLRRGDTIEIAGEIFEVRGDPVRDGDRLTWAAEARSL